jgi:carbamoyl-phosphate synthase large subunit
MNVLITSASAKVQLVRAFQEAVHPIGGLVVAADIDPMAPALHAADAGAILPRSDTDAFAPALHALCAERAIGLLVPTRDGELTVLSRLATALGCAGTTVVVSPAPVLAITGDKLALREFCIARGYPVARRIGTGASADDLPAFARPRRGAAGRGAVRLDTVDALAAALADPDLLVEAFIDAPEYSIDALLDLQGEPIQAVVRSRLVVRHGESHVGRVEDRPELAALALRLCADLGIVGPAVVQAFRSEYGEVRLIEVNPRFGGASSLAIRAGLDAPSRLVALVSGRDADARRARPIATGLTSLRYAEDVLVPWAAIASLGNRGA